MDQMMTLLQGLSALDKSRSSQHKIHVDFVT